MPKKGVGVNMPEKYANVLFYLYKKELAVYHFGMSTKSPFIRGPFKLAHGRCLLVLINFLRAQVVLLMLEKDFSQCCSSNVLVPTLRFGYGHQQRLQRRPHPP